MSDEEDDYMSDAFLQQCESVKPGLAWGKAAKQNKLDDQRRAAAEKHRAKFKPVKVREEEQRVEGLSKAITSDNKGFAMLQKMGYKKGMGLGKTESGRAEPIPIDFRAGRGGLGRENEMKRRQQTSAEMRQQMFHKRAKMEVVNRGNFRENMSSRFKDKEVEKDLYSSQKACEHLDQTQDISEPVETWSWPKRIEEKKLVDDEKEEEDEEEEEEEEKEEEDKTEEEEEKEEETEDSLTSQEKLCQLTNYLRSEHRYCVWCGTSFEDEKDLSSNCPGNTADDHR